MRRIISSALVASSLALAVSTPALADVNYIPYAKQTAAEKKKVRDFVLDDSFLGHHASFDEFAGSMLAFFITVANGETPEESLKSCQLKDSEVTKEYLINHGARPGEASWNQIYRAVQENPAAQKFDTSITIDSGENYELPPEWQNSNKALYKQVMKSLVYRCGYITESGAPTGVTEPTAADLKKIPFTWATEFHSDKGPGHEKPTDTKPPGNQDKKLGSDQAADPGTTAPAQTDKDNEGSSTGRIIEVAVALVAIAGLVAAAASGMIPGATFPALTPRA